MTKIRSHEDAPRKTLREMAEEKIQEEESAAKKQEETLRELHALATKRVEELGSFGFEVETFDIEQPLFASARKHDSRERRIDFSLCISRWETKDGPLGRPTYHSHESPLIKVRFEGAIPTRRKNFYHDDGDVRSILDQFDQFLLELAVEELRREKASGAE